jgi:hypothetical protein
VQAHQHERIYGLGQQQDFRALALEIVQVRAAQHGFGILADDEIDQLLVRFYAPDIVLQGGPAVGMKVGLEAQKRGNAFALHREGSHALLQVDAELLPERLVFLWIVFGEVLKFLHDLAGNDLFQACHQACGLDGLA